MEVRIDKSFDVKHLSKFSLNLKIGDDFFVANAFKTKSEQHVAIAECKFNNEIQDEFQLSALVKTFKSSPVKISKKYHTINICISNSKFAIVPKVLFEKENCKNYLKLNATTEENQVILHQKIDSSGIVVVFGLHKELYNWIKEVFPKAKIQHELAISVCSIQRDFHDVSGDKTILNIHRNYFDLVYLKKGKINFVNAFPYTEKEDLLYYVLYCFKQLNLDPKSVSTYLVGEIKKGDELHQILFQFIKNIGFGNRNKNIKVAGTLGELPKHYFYSVFNTNLCE